MNLFIIIFFFAVHLTTKVDRYQNGSEHISVLDHFFRILDKQTFEGNM